VIEFVRNYIKGIIIGIAEVIPGVSGSTLALSLNVYDDFIDFLNDFLAWLKQKIGFHFSKLIHVRSFSMVNGKVPVNPNFNFGLPLLLGIISVYFLLINLVGFLIKAIPNYVYSVFFGLVTASILKVWVSINKKTLANVFVIFVSSIFIFLLLGIKPSIVVINPDPIYIFFAAIFVITAMLLPGISGSFVLLVFGIYEYMIELVRSITKLSISPHDLLNLLAFVLGALISFIFFIKFIKTLFLKFKDATYSVLLGLMIGSLRVIFPFFEPVFSSDGKIIDKVPALPNNNYNTFLIFLLIAIGFLVVKLIEKLGKQPKDVNV